MKLKIFSLVVVIATWVLVLLSPLMSQAQPKTKVQDSEITAEIEAKLQSLTLDQKIGQLFIFGLNGKKLEKVNLALLKQQKPGGLIIFGRNISSHQQIAQLNYSARELSERVSNLPLLVMVDQEGGSVTRIKTKPSAPSALALGMTKDLNLIEQAGKISGEMLSLLGFNMNLAPVMDLSPPEKKNFIGNRSFGMNPESVKMMAQAFANGQLSTGILPTAKHFPGHGNIAQDSHKTLPVKTETIEELNTADLIPFSHFVEHSYPSAIMIAHIAFPNIDPSGVPAAFSSVLINNLLRDRMGYNGLVITDDIEMAGADSVGNIGERAVRAIEAGCDMIMVAWSPARQGRALAAVKAAVTSGRLSMDRVDDSLRRIIQAKMKLKSVSNEIPPAALISKKMRGLVADLKSLTHKVSQTNFKKAAENYPHLKGQTSAQQEILIFSSDKSFISSFQETRYGKTKAFPLAPGKADPVVKASKKYPSSMVVYYVTGEGTARRVRSFTPELKSRMVVVNATNPGLIGDDEEFKAVFDIHSSDFESGRWIAEFLFEGDLRTPSSKPEEARRSSRKKPRI